VPQLAQVDLVSLSARFLGAIDQVPPEFSAIKQGGVPMYRLARRGQAPRLAARRVVVHELRLEANGNDRLTIEVRCSKGTYVRSLARDIGIALGCAAHLESLRRISFGQFDLAQAVPLDELRTESPTETVRVRTIDPLTALAALRRLAVDPAAAQRLRAGQQGALSPLSPPTVSGERACVVDGSGGLVAVVMEAAGRWRIDRVFADRIRLAR
jgi:tRNA pseudouridine55 synthase